ncbi:hypothetical protein E4O96_13795 [Pseudomonas fluorescens]|nr:hypothetical protein [Pseudomonas fluorescens]
MAVARQIVATQLVAHDVEHVAHGFWFRHGGLPDEGQERFFAVRRVCWQVHLRSGFYAGNAWVWLLAPSQASQLPQGNAFQMGKPAASRRSST